MFFCIFQACCVEHDSPKVKTGVEILPEMSSSNESQQSKSQSSPLDEIRIVNSINEIETPDDPQPKANNVPHAMMLVAQTSSNSTTMTTTTTKVVPETKHVATSMSQMDLSVKSDWKSHNTTSLLIRPNITNILKKRQKIDIKRERKAAKTLGVIMSCFILCWLPFFLMQIFFAVCKECYITNLLEKSPLVTVLTWCGYLNSLLNPIIYTIFSPDFRSAFKKILFGKYSKKRHKRNYLK